MTLIIGARCQDGVVIAADRRRLSRHERGPSTTKLFKLSCGAAIAGAGDDAVLNEARILIDRQIKELANGSPVTSLFDVVEIAAGITNDLVGRYQNAMEESFGYVLSGTDNLNTGKARLFTVFGAGLSELPWVCLGSGSSYARPLVELLLADGNLPAQDAQKIVVYIFSLVSNVLTTVGDGIDISICKDSQVAGDIAYLKEASLDRLRTAILNTILKG